MPPMKFTVMKQNSGLSISFYSFEMSTWQNLIWLLEYASIKLQFWWLSWLISIKKREKFEIELENLLSTDGLVQCQT